MPCVGRWMPLLVAFSVTDAAAANFHQALCSLSNSDHSLPQVPDVRRAETDAAAANLACP